MDKYFELYKPGVCVCVCFGGVSAGLAGLGRRAPGRKKAATPATVQRGAVAAGLRAEGRPQLSSAAGHGSAGGFIRVAISFLEPDQVRSGELEGSARDGNTAVVGKRG